MGVPTAIRARQFMRHCRVNRTAFTRQRISRMITEVPIRQMSTDSNSGIVDNPAKDSGCHQFLGRHQCIRNRRVVMAFRIPDLAERSCE